MLFDSGLTFADIAWLDICIHLQNDGNSFVRYKQSGLTGWYLMNLYQCCRVSIGQDRQPRHCIMKYLFVIWIHQIQHITPLPCHETLTNHPVYLLIRFEQWTNKLAHILVFTEWPAGDASTLHYQLINNE